MYSWRSTPPGAVRMHHLLLPAASIAARNFMKVMSTRKALSTGSDLFVLLEWFACLKSKQVGRSCAQSSLRLGRQQRVYGRFPEIDRIESVVRFGSTLMPPRPGPAGFLFLVRRRHRQLSAVVRRRCLLWLQRRRQRSGGTHLVCRRLLKRLRNRFCLSRFARQALVVEFMVVEV